MPKKTGKYYGGGRSPLSKDEPTVSYTLKITEGLKTKLKGKAEQVRKLLEIAFNNGA